MVIMYTTGDVTCKTDQALYLNEEPVNSVWLDNCYSIRPDQTDRVYTREEGKPS